MSGDSLTARLYSQLGEEIAIGGDIRIITKKLRAYFGSEVLSDEVVTKKGLIPALKEAKVMPDEAITALEISVAMSLFERATKSTKA